MSQDLLGERVHYSGALIGQIETSKRMPSADLARRCDEALGTGDVLARLWPLVSKETYPSWFRPFVELEREATSLREFMPLGMPGLLQTEDYARALFRAGRPADTIAQIEAAQRPRIVVQVVPLSSGEHAGIEGGFTIASFADAPDVAYLDTAVRGRLPTAAPKWMSV